MLDKGPDLKNLTDNAANKGYLKWKKQPRISLINLMVKNRIPLQTTEDLTLKVDKYNYTNETLGKCYESGYFDSYNELQGFGLRYFENGEI